MNQISPYSQLPPQDQKSEDMLIGFCIASPDAFQSIARIISYDDFYIPQNQIIFQSFIRLYSEGHEINSFNVVADLRRNAAIEKAGGLSRILSLSSTITGTISLELVAKEIKDASIKRKAIHWAHDIIRKAYDPVNYGHQMLGEILQDIDDLYRQTVAQNQPDFKDQYLDVLDNISEKKEGLLGISTGFKSWDEKTGGLCGPDLTIIAAGTSEGKSTIALNIARHVAENEGGVLYFSTEMGATQFIYRIISDITNTSVSDVRKGNIDQDKFKLLNNDSVYNAKLHFYYKGGITIDDITSITKAELVRKNIKLIVIDYIQQIRTGFSKRKFANRTDEMTDISGKLKNLAMDANIPVIALSQLNRLRGRKTYNNSDLRDSGSIEQDADNIFFLYRPLYHKNQIYELRSGGEIVADDNTTIIINTKQRNGEPSEWVMNFQGKYSRFEDLKSENIQNDNDETPF